MNEKTISIVMFEVNRLKVAEVLSDEVIITTQDALDLLANAGLVTKRLTVSFSMKRICCQTFST